MVKHSTSHGYKVEFEYCLSPIDKWIVRKNDLNFGRFIEILHVIV
jgi:hypothetical protein